jgi:hypothetical protein
MKWLLTCVLAVGLSGCAAKTPAPADDVAFAKTSMTALAGGDSSAESMIDFDNFKAGIDAGAIYRSMPNDTEKAAFRKSFVASFSKSFASSGAQVGSMTNWRVHSGAPPRTVVVADGPKMPLYMTVTQTGGQQKLASISPTP